MEVEPDTKRARLDDKRGRPPAARRGAMVEWADLAKRAINGAIVVVIGVCVSGWLLLWIYNGVTDQYPTAFAAGWYAFVGALWAGVLFRHWREAQEPRGRPLSPVFVVAFGVYYVLSAILAFGTFVALALQDAVATGGWAALTLVLIVALLVVWCRKEVAKQRLADDFLSDGEEATLCTSVPLNVALLGACVVALFFQLCMAAQAFGAAADYVSVSAPGDTLDVADNSTGELGAMHMFCLEPDFGGAAGVDLPTVVFEPSVNELGASWSLVQPLVATLTRACYYDRKGYGFSWRGAQPRRAGGMAAELHSLLSARFIDVGAGRTRIPRVVLVAHGFGSVIAHAFAHEYGFGGAPSALVAGLVYVDGVHGAQQTIETDSDVALFGADADTALGANNGPTPYDQFVRFIIPLGFVRMGEGAAVETGSLGFPFELLRRLPPARFAEYRAALLGYYHANAVVQEKREWTSGSRDDVAALFAEGELGALPYAVLAKQRAYTNDAAHADYRSFQERLAALATRNATSFASGAPPDDAALPDVLRYANATDYLLFRDPSAIVDAIVDTVARAYWQYELTDELSGTRRRRRAAPRADDATFVAVRDRLRAHMVRNARHMLTDEHKATTLHSAAHLRGAAPSWLRDAL